MSHNFDAQRRETFNTFRDMPKGMKKLPERAEVDFLFYPEEHDANYGAVMKALTATEVALAYDFYPDGWDLGLEDQPS
jgi:hypothetical protein